MFDYDEVYLFNEKVSKIDISLCSPDRKKELLSILENQPIEILETIVHTIKTFKS